MSERSVRRFFIYFCAFVGAGLFGYEIYLFATTFHRWPSEFTWIIIAALVVAALFTWRTQAEEKDQN